MLMEGSLLVRTLDFGSKLNVFWRATICSELFPSNEFLVYNQKKDLLVDLEFFSKIKTDEAQKILEFS